MWLTFTALKLTQVFVAHAYRSTLLICSHWISRTAESDEGLTSAGRFKGRLEFDPQCDILCKKSEVLVKDWRRKSASQAFRLLRSEAEKSPVKHNERQAFIRWLVDQCYGCCIRSLPCLSQVRYVHNVYDFFCLCRIQNFHLAECLTGVIISMYVLRNM